MINLLYLDELLDQSVDTVLEFDNEEDSIVFLDNIAEFFEEELRLQKSANNGTFTFHLSGCVDHVRINAQNIAIQREVQRQQRQALAEPQQVEAKSREQERKPSADASRTIPNGDFTILRLIMALIVGHLSGS